VSRILVIMLTMSTFALASSAEHGATDIVQRSVNFFLFAGLVWYLVAEPAKNFFASRSQAIADDLKMVQTKLNESITLKKEALAKIIEAEKFAEELAKNSKKENKMVNDNIMAQCDSDLESLLKQQNTLIEFEQRNMIKDVVNDILKKTLSQSAKSFDKEAMANVILKKVA